MKKIMSVAVTSVVLGSVGANASVSDAEWNELKAQPSHHAFYDAHPGAAYDF